MNTYNFCVLIRFTMYSRNLYLRWIKIKSNSSYLVSFSFVCCRWTRQTVFYRVDSVLDRTWVTRFCALWSIPEITIDWGIFRWTEDSPIPSKKLYRGYVYVDLYFYSKSNRVLSSIDVDINRSLNLNQSKSTDYQWNLTDSNS